MKSFKISLNDVTLVKEFVNLTGKIVGDVTLKSDRWAIDGKSIMGILSLDLRKELDCEIEASESQIKIFEDGLKSLHLI